VRIAILDACRDNTAERELKRQAAPRGGEVSRGLGPMRNPEGLILAYATQYLSTAADIGTKGNSPFTAALLNNIATPGLDIKDLFFKVGREVVAATQGNQRPEISISIYDQYVLVPATAKPAAAAPANPSTFPQPPPARPAAPPQVAAAGPPVAPVMPPSDPCSGAVTVSFSSRCAAPLTAAQERDLKPKDSFRECDKCPEMVVVPAGSFTMGSPNGEKARDKSEGPQHRVTFDRPFAVGKFAVTFEEWDACFADGGCNCANDGGCNYRPDDQGWGRGRQPVIDVSWDDAKNYVAWLSRKTGKTYRLLSEAEREYVTRAGTNTPFWWGGSISSQQANYDSNYTYGGPKGEYRQRTLPVDSFQANSWGLYQVHGNVWEWAEDCYHDSYQGAPTDGSAWTSCSVHVVRGGSWSNGPRYLRAAIRLWYPSDWRGNDIGFRVGRTLTP
jgi:formylglycine-generating enzyme required for sulfatase activity